MLKRVVFGSLVSVVAAAILAAGAGRAEAQNAVISGHVTGEGQPLGGAIVVIPELSLQVATTAGGAYTLTVAAERLRGQAVALTVRYIGYRPETRRITLTRGPQVQDFTLVTDPLLLSELVVTGTAEATPLKELSFAVGAVSEASLLEVPAVDPIHALEGKVPGAQVVSPAGQPGSAAAVRLRGATTLTPGASQDPLLIVDGVITQGTLADLNAEDIERIEVVKGAAASSIYGSNAAAGVIQVFTRRGAQNADGQTTVTVRNEVGTQSLSRRMPINHSHYWQMAGDTFALDADGNKILQANHFMDQPYPKATPWRDQQSAVLGPGLNYTNYVAVGRRQGANNLQLSFENHSDDGIVNFRKCEPASLGGICSGTDLGYIRRNVRINIDQGISDRLDVSVGAFYNESHNRQQGISWGVFADVLFTPPDVDLYNSVNTNGEPFRIDILKDAALSSNGANPLYNATHHHDELDRTRVQGSARLRWRPTEWLSFEGTFSYDRSGENEKIYAPKGMLQIGAAPFIGYLSLSQSFDRSFNGSISASLQKTFGELQARLKLSGTIEDESFGQFGGAGSGFATLGTPELSNLSRQESKSVVSSDGINRARNVFAVAGLTYKSRYIVDALIRRDGSSLFGSGARYHTYYRYSGAYRLSQDVKIPGIQELKLRASVGTAGLRPPFNAQYETFITANGSISPGVVGNKLLRPALSKETELGFNLEFLNRFSLEYSNARKVTSDQVLPVPLSSSAGYTAQWRNAGTLEGTTNELALGASLINSRNMTWNLNVTWDRTRMRVTQLATQPFAAGLYNLSLFLIKQGAVYGSMWGYRFATSRKDLTDNPANWSGGQWGVGTMTLDTTLYSRNSDGLVVKTDSMNKPEERAFKYVDRTGSTYYQIGDANPSFTMSFSTTLSYRGFTVYGLLDWAKGGDIYNLPRQFLERSEFLSGEMDQAGKPASAKHAYDYYSAIQNANAPNSRYVENGTYARLRELSVSYSVSPRALRSIALGRLVRTLRLGVAGRNLLTWTRYSGLDPETYNAVGQGGDPTTFRYDGFNYPNFRTFSGYVEIGF